jgi:hypothetical protein
MYMSIVEVERLLREDGCTEIEIRKVVAWIADEMDMDARDEFKIPMIWFCNKIRHLMRA